MLKYILGSKKSVGNSNSYEEFLLKHEYFANNPGGSWLLIEKENAVKLAKARQYTDVVTAVFQCPVNLSVEKIKNYRLLKNSISEASKNERVIRKISHAMKNGQWKWRESLIPFLNVEHDGEVSINKGHQVICAANDAGMEVVPCLIAYYAGGELVEGALSPDNVYNMVNEISENNR